MKVKPLGDRYLIQRDLLKEEVSPAGIIKPLMSGDKAYTGTVLSRNPRWCNYTNLDGMDIGVKVMFGKYAGSDISIDGKPVVIVREEDLLAIIEEKEDDED